MKFFAKIFVWFFAAVAMLILASYELTRLTERDPSNVVRRWGDPFLLHAEYARETLARDGRPGLERLLRRMDESSRLQAYVIDRSGHELGGRPVPPEVDSLALRVLSGHEAGGRSPERPPAFAYPLGAGAGLDSSVLVLVPPRMPHRFPILPHNATNVVITLIAIGGLFSYGLARHLTAPVTKLRRAVAKLGTGDLSARVSDAPARGGDEIAALGRDFNRMAERIESLVASHRQLLRDVSHELRSPLARIRVAVALGQQEQGSGKGTGDPLFGRIEHEAERLEALIAQILTLSRLDSGEGTMKPERLDLNELVQGIADDARFEAAANGVQVRRVGEPAGQPRAALEVTGDASILRSAIENVVRNAVRVSPGGSSVEIETRLVPGNGAGPQAVVTVLDRGPGVAPEQLESIFEPFIRGEKSRDRRSGGVGLGLAIARRGIESHGGTIGARLRPEGGLVVEMRLPCEMPGTG
jgi:two-component system sensor histidine kinase CpxA